MTVRATYQTKPREEIAAVLRTAPRFFTAAEIHDRLHRRGSRVSLSTVYRTLDHLQQRGEVTQRADEAGEAAFMACEPSHHHHHAICSRCGNVSDVDCDALDVFVEALRERHGFELDAHNMEFIGRCQACR